MKTPDKIYLHGYDFSEKPVKSWSEQPVNGMKGHEATNVEYIRKDAVLELLQNRNKEIRGAAYCAFRSFELQEIYWRINEL